MMHTLQKTIAVTFVLLLVACQPAPPEQTTNDNIRVSSPTANSTVSAVIPVRGEARGTWYFEATFPLHIEDMEGNILAQSYAQAEGEWMTENFVPFYGEIQLTQAFTGNAILVVEKDNPSGLPENAAEIRIPIVVDTQELSAEEKESIEEYLRDNIGEISPVDPVLGGTFYLVDVDWQPDNTALVTYEDGHIQVKATAVIGIADSGEITLDSFTVIDE